MRNIVKKQTESYLGLDGDKIKFSRHIKLNNERLRR